jgi:S1-C subfamily serine protease
MAAMAAHKQTLYQILGVAPDATVAEIDLAYERRAAELQGAAPHDPNAIALAHEAYEVLRNPARRQAYDASLVTAQERAAASEQSTDLMLEPEPKRKPRLSWPLLAAIAALAVVIIYYALRPSRIPDPQNEPPVAQAPLPAPTPPPPPPRDRTSAEILKEALAGAGRLSSVEMSGRATPLGVAIAIEPGTMVTTCHGIPGGSKLVVQLGKETFPADLAITDERYNLCRLTVPGLAAKPVAIAREDVAAGTRIHALGLNAAGDFALTEGTVKQVRAAEGSLLELSMPIAATGSGGAIFDSQGRLVGIATTQYRDVKSNSLALPASWISQMRSRGAS